MEFIRPMIWNDACLTSTTAVDTAVDLWLVGTAYDPDDVVRLDTTHKEYICLVANTGVSPDTDEEKWLDRGATNSRKAFDNTWGTQSVGGSPLVIVITPGVYVDSMALLNLNGENVNVTATTGGAEVFNEDYVLTSDEGITDWLGYFINESALKSDILVLGLPIYLDLVITITITGTGTVGVGGIHPGRMRNLGITLYNPTIGILDYSKKDTDEFGNITVIPRAYSKRFSARFYIDNANVDYVAALLASVRSTPCVWIGKGISYSSMIVWGFYKDWEIDIAYFDTSYGSITIEGII